MTGRPVGMSGPNPIIREPGRLVGERTDRLERDAQIAKAKAAAVSNGAARTQADRDRPILQGGVRSSCGASAACRSTLVCSASSENEEAPSFGGPDRFRLLGRVRVNFPEKRSFKVVLAVFAIACFAAGVILR